MSPSTTRRLFTQQTLGSILTASLLQTLFETDVLAAKVKPITEQWLKDLVETSRSLDGRKITQPVWQAKVEELFQQVELKEMFRLIDFEKLRQQSGGRARGGERSIRIEFPQIEGLPVHLGFGRQVFEVQPGSSVVPHGHNNMATAFYVLDGQFHGRHYDRVRDEDGFMMIKPTIDDTFGPTSCTTVTDFKDNVHWFTAVSKVGYLFNIHVIDYDRTDTGRVYVDPSGEKTAGGLIRAPIIDGKTAYQKYG